MALSEKQKQWLNVLDSQAKIKQVLDERRAQKEAMMLQIRQQLVKDGEWLLDKMQLDVSDGKKTQKLLNYEERDQTTEFDIDEMLDGYTLESDEDLAKHSQAGRFITLLAKKLDQQVPEIDENGKETGKMVPMFSNEEIAQEYFRPLVREGLMPETLVPNEFSETHEMIKGTFEAYQERLDKDYVGGKKGFLKRMWSENGALAKSVLTAGVTIGSSIETLKGLGDLSADDVVPKWDQFQDGEGGSRMKNFFLGAKDSETGERDQGASYVLGMVGFGLDMLSKEEDLRGTITGEVSDVRTQINLKNAPPRVKFASKIAQAIAGQMSTAVGQLLNTGGLGVVASSAFSTMLNTSKIAKEMQGEAIADSNIQAISKVIQEAMSKTLTSVAPDKDNCKQVLGTAATQASNSIKSSLESKKSTILAELGATDEFDATKVLKPFTEAADTMSKLTIPGLEALLNDTKTADAMRLRMTQVMNDAAAKETEENRKREEAEKEAIDKETDMRKAAMKIERKILALQRKKRWLSMGSGLVSMGFGMAAKAIGPLAIVGSAFKIMMAIKDAAEHTIDLVRWVNQRTDMLRAASPYSAPVANFIDHAALEAAHAEAKIAIEAVTMIGAIIECAGGHIGVAVGKGIQAGAAIAGAIEDVLYELKKRYDLEKAWQSYKLAMLRPANRKLALIAMHKNPTLAKYAIAWGAVIKQDPLVQNFLTTCQLKADNLEGKENLHLVERYLEARMPAANVATGRQPVVADWAPKTIELTAACWTATKKRGERKADLQPSQTADLDQALSKFGPLYKTTEAHQDRTTERAKKDATRCKELLGTIIGGLAGYAPQRIVKGNKVPHREMEEIVAQLKKEAEEKLSQADEWLNG